MLYFCKHYTRIIMNEYAIEINGLSKIIKKRKILNNIFIKFPKGKVVGFLGPNGSGKTTTFKCILNLVNFEGTIKLSGIDNKICPLESIGKVGAIIEEPCFYYNMTGYKNLLIASEYYDCIPEKRISYLIDLFDMNHYINQKVKNYSLGMKQRLGIAMSMIHSPEILILDEPMNGLDPEGIRDLRCILKKLCLEEEKTIVVSSHILSEMQLLCDEVVFIKNGEIIGCERVNETLEDRYLAVIGTKGER